MNHYPHHIGDFDRATRHLNRMERSVYRDLLDLYYDTETRLTLDMNVLCRRIIARSNEESTAVEQVLNEFFTKTDTGWYHDRCEEEIDAYRANNSQRAQAGKASAAAKLLKKQQIINGSSTPVERQLNSVGLDVERESNDAPTNQNQNQNQNQEEKDALPAQPPDVPDGTARVPMAGVICMAMKAAGIGITNPSHLEIQTLLDKGADIGMFVGAAKSAVEKQKGFAYALGVVKGQMKDAAALAQTALASPSMTAANSETAYQRSMRLRVAEVSPLLARPAPGHPPAVNATEYFQNIPAIEVTK